MNIRNINKILILSSLLIAPAMATTSSSDVQHPIVAGLEASDISKFSVMNKKRNDLTRELLGTLEDAKRKGDVAAVDTAEKLYKDTMAAFDARIKQLTTKAIADKEAKKQEENKEKEDFAKKHKDELEKKK